MAKKQESDADKLVCYLAHEIGAGYYYAYVWGQQAREFFSMTDMGYSIASNLHTDTLEQLYNQLCEKNNVPKTWVNNVTLKVFLRLRRMPDGRIHRWISHVYEYDGVQDNLVWTGNEHGIYSRLDDSRFVTRSVEKKYGDFLAVCRQRQIFTIKDVRQELISI